MGHVSNEELSAFYDVADLFLCASEHEGFCVPLMEAFHKRVPVLAYAATAVPSTMDGGGVLYDTKSPAHVASLMAAILDDEDLVERIIASQDAALARLVAQDFDGTLLRFVDEALAAPPGSTPPVSFDFWDQFELQEQLEEVRQYRPSALRALPDAAPASGSVRDRKGPSRPNASERTKESESEAQSESRLPAPEVMLSVHQWVPAAHKGDAIGDSARRVRELLRARGHESEIFALTIDDDLRHEIRPFADPEARRGDVTIFHFALPSPMTAAFASLPGGRVLQYHNITPAHFFADYAPQIYRLAMLGGRNWPRWSATRTWRLVIRPTTARNSMPSASRRPG